MEKGRTINVVQTVQYKLDMALARMNPAESNTV
jgi:hypothetical protein